MRSFVRFSVLGEISCGFAVFSDFLRGFSVSNRPQCPPLSLLPIRKLNEHHGGKMVDERAQNGAFIPGLLHHVTNYHSMYYSVVELTFDIRMDAMVG